MVQRGPSLCPMTESHEHMNGSTTAFVFPGQGSQHVGMAAALAAAFPTARAVLDEADAVLGMRLSALMTDGPEADLNQTANTQPALYVAGVAALRALESALGGTVRPACAAGHSLGEFTALTAAGALPFATGLKLVQLRGRLMGEAGAKNPGAMAALLGASLDDALAICAEANTDSAPVVVANDNCPGQIVISGASEAVDKAIDIAKGRGIKRAMRLAVSVAAHSPLMSGAAGEFAAALAEVTFATPAYPVIGNTTAAPLDTPADIMAELRAQLTGRVRWTESVQAMRGRGVTTFIELGAKDVLTGLLKRIDKEAVGIPAADPAGIQAAITA